MLGNAEKNAAAKARQAEWRRLRPDRTVAHLRRKEKSSKLRQSAADPEGFRRRASESGRRWRANHPEKMKAQWLNTRARLMASRYGTLYTPQSAEVYQRIADEACFKCNQQPAAGIDHIVPFSKGGSNAEENLQPSCLPCNLRKGSS